MLNYNYYRMSIIFGVLFAAGWMQSTKATELNDTEKIRYFTTSLEYVQKNRRLVPEGGINHFVSWASWNATKTNFKLTCAKDYENRLKAANLNFTAEDKDSLGVLAYKALDLVIKASAYWMKGLLEENRQINEGIDRILRQGEFIHLCAFLEDTLSEPNLQITVDEMRRSNPTISKTEIALRIFANYLLLKYV